MKLFREALGEILREERQAQGLSMRAVSEQAPIALGYLSEVERGQKDPSSEVIHTVSYKGLGVEPQEILLRTAMRMAGFAIPDTPQILYDEYTDLIPQK